MVTKKSDNRATLVTLLNYAKYQGLSAIGGTQQDQQMHHSGTTPDSTPIPQTTMINNDNNDKQDAPPTSTFTPYKGGYGGPYKKTAFHNIEQNEYDFADLERMLLERGRKKLNE